jgi:succinoglycan biosynthesis transport protein ExoP
VNDAKPISIAPYLDVVYRHRLLAFCIFFVCLGTTICLLLMVPNMYRSTAVVVVEPPQVSPDYVDGGSPASHGSNIDVADQLEAFARQAFSEARLEELIRKFGLYQVEADESLEPEVEYMRLHIGLVVPQDSILYKSGAPQQESANVLEISFEHSNPSIAQQVTEQLTTDYIEEGYQQRIKRAEDATRFLTAQVARAKTELEAKSKQVQELQRHYQGSLPEELEPNMAELGRLENQLGMINQQLTTERLSPMAVGQLVPSAPEQQLPALELKLAALRAQFSDEYPDVSQLKQQIADLKQQILQDRTAGAETSNAAGRVNDAEPPQTGLERQAATLSAQIASLNLRISATSAHGQELDALKRDYDASDTEYHGLLKKQLSAQLRETLEKRHQDERLRLLEGADLPRKPIRPNRKMIGIAGLMFSLVAALALPFGLYFTDTSFKEPAELQGEYGIAVVAAIPAVKMPSDHRAFVVRAAFVSSVAMLVIGFAIWSLRNRVF